MGLWGWVVSQVLPVNLEVWIADQVSPEVQGALSAGGESLVVQAWIVALDG